MPYLSSPGVAESDVYPLGRPGPNVPGEPCADRYLNRPFFLVGMTESAGRGNDEYYWAIEDLPRGRRLPTDEVVCRSTDGGPARIGHGHFMITQRENCGGHRQADQIRHRLVDSGAEFAGIQYSGVPLLHLHVRRGGGLDHGVGWWVCDRVGAGRGAGWRGWWWCGGWGDGRRCWVGGRRAGRRSRSRVRRVAARGGCQQAPRQRDRRDPTDDRCGGCRPAAAVAHEVSRFVAFSYGSDTMRNQRSVVALESGDPAPGSGCSGAALGHRHQGDLT